MEDPREEHKVTFSEEVVVNSQKILSSHHISKNKNEDSFNSMRESDHQHEKFINQNFKNTPEEVEDTDPLIQKLETDWETQNARVERVKIDYDIAMQFVDKKL